ncbi:hypothetical protein pb186bvf_012127 [Paramecium bursaria]
MLDSNFLDDLEDQEQEVMEIEVVSSNFFKDQEFQKFYERVQNLREEEVQSLHEEYQLILKTNDYCSAIEKEINNIHKRLKDVYYKRFPELEQIITNPLDYVKIVSLIKNQCDLRKIDFLSILSGHQVVAVNVAASSTQGQLLSEEELQKVEHLCNEILTLENYNINLLAYIESRMKFIAPNLSALIGTQAASKIIAKSGGVDKLANMPACNIQVMGSLKQNLLGFSKVGQDRNMGLFSSLDLVQGAPSKFQKNIVRMLSTNVALAARVDNLKTSPNGKIGEQLKEKMMNRFQKIQEPPPAKLNKPLPVPDENKKKKRGGRRYRALKEKKAQTEIRKFQNRLKFGAEAEKEIDNTGKGLGMLSQGIGKVKLQTKQNQKIGLSKKLRDKLQQMKQKQSSGNTGGATSSIVFTPTQGMALLNPNSGFQSKAPDQGWIQKCTLTIRKNSRFQILIIMQKYTQFFLLSQQLKLTKRKGWTRFPEIKEVESVADHSWMIGLIALSLPNKFNKDEAIKIALLHDLAEVIVGDIIPSENVPADEKKQKENNAIQFMIKDLDQDIKNELYRIHQEYENGQSVEAQIVRELDKYEMMVQAFHYEQKYKINLEEFFSGQYKLQNQFK